MESVHCVQCLQPPIPTAAASFSCVQWGLSLARTIGNQLHMYVLYGELGVLTPEVVCTQLYIAGSVIHREVSYNHCSFVERGSMQCGNNIHTANLYLIMTYRVSCQNSQVMRPCKTLDQACMQSRPYYCLHTVQYMCRLW